jgi:hypothetical protein
MKAMLIIILKKVRTHDLAFYVFSLPDFFLYPIDAKQKIYKSHKYIYIIIQNIEKLRWVVGSFVHALFSLN